MAPSHVYIFKHFCSISEQLFLTFLIDIHYNKVINPADILPVHLLATRKATSVQQGAYYGVMPCQRMHLLSKCTLYHRNSPLTERISALSAPTASCNAFVSVDELAGAP